MGNQSDEAMRPVRIIVAEHAGRRIGYKPCRHFTCRVLCCLVMDTNQSVCSVFHMWSHAHSGLRATCLAMTSR